ncbi:fucolectin-like [Pelodytes ibericus]
MKDSPVLKIRVPESLTFMYSLDLASTYGISIQALHTYYLFSSIRIMADTKPDTMIFCLVSLVGIFTVGQSGPSCAPGPRGKNLALAGEVYPSSENILGAARRVIDGNKATDFRSGSCFETTLERPSWWALDLMANYKINTIVVVNRGDCCEERLKGAQVRIGKTLSTTTICSVITDVRSPEITICCKGQVGRYVTIIIKDRREYLSLCEVEVYGDMFNDRTVCQ